MKRTTAERVLSLVMSVLLVVNTMPAPAIAEAVSEIPDATKPGGV